MTFALLYGLALAAKSASHIGPLIGIQYPTWLEANRWEIKQLEQHYLQLAKVDPDVLRHWIKNYVECKDLYPKYKKYTTWSRAEEAQIRALNIGILNRLLFPDDIVGYKVNGFAFPLTNSIFPWTRDPKEGFVLRDSSSTIILLHPIYNSLAEFDGLLAMHRKRMVRDGTSGPSLK